MLAAIISLWLPWHDDVKKRKNGRNIQFLLTKIQKLWNRKKTRFFAWNLLKIELITRLKKKNLDTRLILFKNCDTWKYDKRWWDCLLQQIKSSYTIKSPVINELMWKFSLTLLDLFLCSNLLFSFLYVLTCLSKARIFRNSTENAFSYGRDHWLFFIKWKNIWRFFLEKKLK